MLLSNWKKISETKVFWPLVALLALFVFNYFYIPGFFKIVLKDGHLFGSFIDILNRAAPLIIVSIGMTLVISTAGVDISVGSTVAIAGALAAYMMGGNSTGGHSSLTIAILLSLGLSLLCGMWNGLLVAKIGIQPMVATLILMTVGRGIAQLISNGQIITVSSESFHYLGGGYLFGIPFAIFVTGIVALFVFLLTRKTAMGLFLESVGGNVESSRFTGINSKLIIFWAYAICGICAGIAGILICSNVKSADGNNSGLWMELDAILSVVLGGTSMNGGRFYLSGTIVGAIFLQTLKTTIYSTGVPPESVLVVEAIVVIIVSLIQSEQFRNMITIKKKSRKRVFQANEKQAAN
ncbi:ABC transporter permease [Neobacillus cucumis]|uniref:ABC transporter permease n=1 Tax=Neobacillus cucumis TaxID=1740721 RepID=UPI002E23389D|nr:ABC transporter permease [Neobacillus cucumis]